MHMQTLESSSAADQDRRDEEYNEAWRNSPRSFISAAAKLGLKPDRSGVSSAIAFDETRDTTSYVVDYAGEIDTTIDILSERHGNPKIVADVIDSLEGLIRKDVEQEQANKITRIFCYLVNAPKGNVLARIHGVMHAIPGLAAAEEFGSLRESARSCGVSPQWMMESRNIACDLLGIPIPQRNAKSDEAKEKYRLRISWRYRTMQAK